LYAVSARGGAPRVVAKLYKWEGWTLRWSPDGQHLSAFAYLTRTDTATNVLMVVPAAGGEPRRVTPLEETGYKEIAEWHPDSRRLTYMYYGHDDRGDETRWAHVDGRPTSRMLDQPYPIWDYIGTWHPNGRDFYFIASTGAWNLYAHDATTGASRVVWNASGTNPGAQGQASFNRDGSMIAWETGTTTRQLWVMERAKP
jgi:Tol biopolymer transport system component